LLRLNKKAVSIMVGYVLLIAIAVSLSTAVFFYLKLYLPDERPECEVDIQLTIDSVKCVWNAATSPIYVDIDLNMTNRGLFNVEGAFIKIGDYNRVYRTDLNPPNDPTNIISICNGASGVLKPGEKFCGDYTYSLVPNVTQEISVQPVVWIDNKPVLCPNAVVTKTIVCVAP